MEHWRESANRMVQAILAQYPDLSAPVSHVFTSVPRHEFLVDAAYEDSVLPIQGSAGRTASISQPSVVASMLEALGVRRGQRVLEIGAGSGYVAALLSELTGDDVCVTTLDVDPVLVEKARKNLGQVGKSAVRVLEADAFVCPPELAGEEFDRVLFSAGVQFPPQWIVRSLSDGGVMVFPLDLLTASPGWPCFLARLEKEGDGLRGRFTTEIVQSWIPLEHTDSLLATRPHPGWGANEAYELFESLQKGLIRGSPAGLLVYLAGGIEAALEAGRIGGLDDCRLWLQSSGWQEINERWLRAGSPTNASFVLGLSDSPPEVPPDTELVWTRESAERIMYLLATKA